MYFKYRVPTLNVQVHITPLRKFKSHVIVFNTGPDLTPKEVDVTFYIGAQQRNPASSHPTLNHLSFYMPPSPLLHQSQFIPADDFCYYENYPTNCENEVCSCINTLHVKLNQVRPVELCPNLDTFPNQDSEVVGPLKSS